MTSIMHYGRDVYGYCHLCLTIRCRHPAPWSRLNPTSKAACVCLQGPASCHKIMVSSTFHQIQNIFFQIEVHCRQCFLRSKYIERSELSRKLWSLRSCYLISPPGALTPQGIEGAMKRDVSKHLCTLQWCASKGWVIAHEKWTSCKEK